MEQIKLIEVKEDILADNDKKAAEIRAGLAKKGLMMLNLMASPGAGKTSFIIRTINVLHPGTRIGVMEADIDSMVDAEKVAETGAFAIQLKTGGFCHLDATMVETGLNEMPVENLDLIIIENVGNLVCPAEFDTGAMKNIMILSVPEGDDKPLKYPLMFSVCDVLIVNKTDMTHLTDFNMDLLTQRVRRLNPKIEIFPLSCRTGEGVDQWTEWLKNLLKI